MIITLMVMAFLISALLTRYFSQPKNRLYHLDKPNARSLHTHPIPINGGLAILISFTISTVFIYWYLKPSQDFFWIASGLLIAIISLIDDFYHVSAINRLLLHFIATYLFLWQSEFWLTHLVLPGITWALSPFLQTSISFLFVVWMLNLYNFMDGIDGFAGGMAIIGFGTFAVLGGLAEQPLFMAINLMVASATGGFLIFNYPPARIFMGDVGASSLGFLAGAFSLWGNHEGIFPLWVALLLFSPFIVDATTTLLRRTLRGKKIWQAHKSHYYQQLVQLGWGHKRTVLWEYALMATCSFSALIAPFLPVYAQWYLLICYAIIYILLIYFVNWLGSVKKI